jgi:hypothetical protein
MQSQREESLTVKSNSVVNVLYRTTAENISTAQIQSQIDIS